LMIRRIRVYIYPAKPGFSLIELSIVLVILGLLTGGILAGQSLIRAAELRSVGEEYQKNRTAVATFRDKYFAIPGDMTNATSFWGLAGGTAA
ncbi:prepilin-type N-terminal cleavage/methylation domain-containing protein, partial [Listeria monocytogenes]|uniref:type II secretion system protein n=1 Tax=Listeria monocytogenes TaxID=1639 RepID=UPI001A9178EA